LRSALFEIARTRASAGIKPAIFNDDFPGLVIYAETIDATNDRLTHVLIADERDSQERNTIIASDGTMISDPATKTVTLRLRDGFIHTTDTKAGSEYQTRFESYDVNLDLRQMFAGSRQKERDPKELTVGQLRRAMEAKAAAGQSFVPELVEFHRKFAIPFACIVFGIVAMPLGIQPVRAARARGFAISLGMIFTYYVMLSFGQALAEQRAVPVLVGLWLPNAVFAVGGVYLFVQAGRERTLEKLDRLQERVAAFRGRLLARLGTETPS